MPRSGLVKQAGGRPWALEDAFARPANSPVAELQALCVAGQGEAPLAELSDRNLAIAQRSTAAAKASLRGLPARESPWRGDTAGIVQPWSKQQPGLFFMARCWYVTGLCAAFISVAFIG